MNNALLYFGGFLVLVLAALFAVPTFIDWNGYRSVFEEQASQVLGRDVRVGGTVNVRLLPTPYVKFEKIRIYEPGELSGEPLFRAESFKLWLSVPPLLRGVFEANQIELKRPVLRLAADATGGGNWSTLTFAAGSLPFVPADVALEQVKVINGVLILSGTQGLELANIDGINGELNSEALEGPYKFKGKFKWEGAEREVRLATARPESNGDVRFKTTVIVANSKNSYVLDGKVADLKSHPRLDGELTATVTLATGSPEGGAEESPSKFLKAAKPAANAEAKSGFDVRGKVVGDTSGFKLQDLTLSLEQAGPPQIVTGEASMAWADKLRIDVALGSRWLELDRAATSGGGVKPMEVARGLFETLTSLLPAEAETNVSLKLDQVNLGSEAVSGVRLAVVRAGGPLELKEFRANVPGGGRLALDGVLSVGQTPAKFEGNMSLDGQSLLRFLAWAFKRPNIGEGRTDSPFAVAGQLQLADKFIAIKDAKAEIGASPMRGDLSLDLDGRRRLSLTLEGTKIDAGQLFSGSVGLRALAAFSRDGEGDAEPAKDTNAAPVVQPVDGGHLFDPTRSDMQLRLRAGQLIDGDRTLNNVTAVLALEGDRLSTDTLSFTTDDGLEVDVSGETKDIRRKPAGELRGIVSAKSAAAVRTLFRLLDVDGKGLAAEDRLAELVPFKLAGSVGLGLRTPDALDVKADGLVAGGRLMTNLRLDAGREGWTASPADMAVTVEGPRATHALAALANPGAVGTGDVVEGSPNRTLTIRAAGIPAKGLVSIAALTGDGLTLDYSGRVTLPAEGKHSASGSLRVASVDAREALAIAGLPFGAGISNVALEGDADVTYDGQTLTLRPKRLSIGGSSIAGVIALSSTGGKPINVTAKLDVDQASLPRLLTPLLVAAPEHPATDPVATVSPAPQQPPRRAAEPPPPASAALTPGIWPEQLFDLSVIDRVQGTIEARFKTLALDDGLNMGDARLVAALEPQGVKITSLEGAALGGKLVSDMMLEKAPAGIGLTGKLHIGVGEAASGANEPADASVASALDLDFSGRALSPAALMTDLRGKGAISLGDVTLTGMGPGPVAATVEAALQGKGPAGGAALTEALKVAMKQGQLRLGALKIPVVIGDGAMKLEKVSLETAEGRSTFETAVELATMKIDSEWKIEAKVRGKTDEAAAKVTLPPVTVVYSGKLKDFATIEPAVETGTLERELTVRKMERDVDELERLRKLDQNKARQEQDRQKALEVEKGKAAAAAVGTSAAPASEPPSGAAGQDMVPVPEAAAPAVATGPEGTAGAAGQDPTPNATNQSGLSTDQPNPAPIKKTRPSTSYKRPAPAWKPFEIAPF